MLFKRHIIYACLFLERKFNYFWEKSLVADLNLLSIDGVRRRVKEKKISRVKVVFEFED
jgi:hypothetical protein